MYVIRVRRGTAQEWTEDNPILLEGEVGYEIDGRTFKVGDGVTSWVDLPYAINEGPPGPIGPGIYIRGVLPNSGSLPISPNLYDYYLLENTGHGALWDGSQWLDTGPLQGPAGDPGNDAPANTLSIGTVTTLAAGESATATITGTPPAQTLSLAIPQGEKGDDGAAGQWWSGTLAQYNDIPVKDPDTLYVVIG